MWVLLPFLCTEKRGIKGKRERDRIQRDREREREGRESVSEDGCEKVLLLLHMLCTVEV